MAEVKDRAGAIRVLDVLEDALSAQGITVEDFVGGDHFDEEIVVFENGERWTIKVRPARKGEGLARALASPVEAGELEDTDDQLEPWLEDMDDQRKPW